MANKHYLGSLSKKYESGNSGPGTIANNKGDIGGASYGTYQIATNTGTMATFLKYLKTANIAMFQALSIHNPGTSCFNDAWKDLAQKHPEEFNEIQHIFIKSSHYDPAVRKIKTALGIDIDDYSLAVQNVLWSTAVQHGSSGALNVFKGAGIKPGMKDEDIIIRVYAERSNNDGKKYFSRSSDSIRRAVVNRFNHEKEDALNMLDQAPKKAKIPDEKEYRLATGDFGSKENLALGKKKLKEKHNWLVYEKIDSAFRLVTGTFKGSESAEEAAASLRSEFGWTVYVQLA